MFDQLVSRNLLNLTTLHCKVQIYSPPQQSFEPNLLIEFYHDDVSDVHVFPGGLV